MLRIEISSVSFTNSSTLTYVKYIKQSFYYLYNKMKILATLLHITLFSYESKQYRASCISFPRVSMESTSRCDVFFFTVLGRVHFEFHILFQLRAEGRVGAAMHTPPPFNDTHDSQCKQD